MRVIYTINIINVYYICVSLVSYYSICICMLHILYYTLPLCMHFLISSSLSKVDVNNTVLIIQYMLYMRYEQFTICMYWYIFDYYTIH